MNLPTPTEVLKTHSLLPLPEFELHKRTLSFELGPFAEKLDSFNARRESQSGAPGSTVLRIVFGRLRGGRNVYSLLTE